MWPCRLLHHFAATEFAPNDYELLARTPGLVELSWRLLSDEADVPLAANALGNLLRGKLMLELLLRRGAAPC